MLYGLKEAAAAGVRLGGKASGLLGAEGRGFKIPETVVVVPREVKDFMTTGRNVRRRLAGFGRLAVRSCGSAEDGEAASFAGQYKTFLNVTNSPSSITDAMVRCYNSQQQAKEYAREMGVSLDDAEFLVLVQPIQPFEVSGIAFMNYEVGYGWRHVKVEAVHGLCDKLAAGTKDPEARWGWLVGTCPKPSFDGGAPSTGGWLNTEYAIHHIQGELDKMAMAYSPQQIDVEWGWTPQDGFVVVQVRPLTTTFNGSAVSGTSMETVTGPARVIAPRRQSDPLMKREMDVRKGEILVTHMTTPQMLRQMIAAKGIVTFIGGETCHAAIVARELDKPAVIGCKDARAIRTGEIIEVNPKLGTVRRVS